MIRSYGRDVNVDITVIVEVTYCTTQPVHLYRKPRLTGHVGEGSVTIIVVERRKRFARLVPGPVHGIHEQNVLPPVVVVIQKTNPTAHGFGEILFAERSAIVFEVNPGLRRDVGELDRAGWSPRSLMRCLRC
jgi:hypothetical protein